MTVPTGAAAQGLELRKAGVPYAVIAERLGLESPDAARELVEPLLQAAVADDAREAGALERLRLTGMLTGLYSKARAGDTRAVEQSLRISERLRLLEAQGAEENGQDDLAGDDDDD